MGRDRLELLRRIALDGIEPVPSTTPLQTRARRHEAGPPREVMGGDVHGVNIEREPLGWVLVDEAERCWRMATGAWVPPLGALVGRGVRRCVLEGRDLVVELGNATYRGRNVDEALRAVMVAMLTEAELVPVRRAMRGGQREFLR